MAKNKGTERVIRIVKMSDGSLRGVEVPEKTAETIATILKTKREKI